MYPKINVNILTWNGEKYLKPCLDSALAQDYSNYEVLIIDNNSSDKTVKIIENYFDSEKRKAKREKHKKISFIQNKENVGFAAGHNQGIKLTDGEYVMLLNQDAILSPSFLSEAIKILEKDKKIAALQPKVLKYDFKANQPKNIFDTTGLLMLKNRRILNRGQGQRDDGQFDKQEEIFGADGAVPVYRRSALEDTRLLIFNNKRISPPSRKATEGASSSNFSLPMADQKEELCEFFDESFFAYKEDVDLAWRLRLYGWKAIYAPSVLAYHERGAGESASKKSLEILKERKGISLFAKKISFKNQRLMQIKNEILSSYIKDFPLIFWKEIRSWGYVVLFERKIFKIIPDLLKQIPKAFRQRKIIMKSKKVGAKEMERWITS
ncbi:MAG: glycosyltransferase family 2 protein [Candidatus Paceibacterota bacterium]|jgi:GT2 family glycosyltransferase